MCVWVCECVCVFECVCTLKVCVCMKVKGQLFRITSFLTPCFKAGSLLYPQCFVPWPSWPANMWPILPSIPTPNLAVGVLELQMCITTSVLFYGRWDRRHHAVLELSIQTRLVLNSETACPLPSKCWVKSNVYRYTSKIWLFPLGSRDWKLVSPSTHWAASPSFWLFVKQPALESRFLIRTWKSYKQKTEQGFTKQHALLFYCQNKTPWPRELVKENI